MPRAQTLTVSKAATYTKLSAGTIHRYRNNGDLSAKKVRGTWTFKSRDLDKLMLIAKPRKKRSKRGPARVAAKRSTRPGPQPKPKPKTENLVSRLKALQKDLEQTGFESVVVTKDGYFLDDVNLEDFS